MINWIFEYSLFQKNIQFSFIFRVQIYCDSIAFIHLWFPKVVNLGRHFWWSVRSDIVTSQLKHQKLLCKNHKNNICNPSNSLNQTLMMISLKLFTPIDNFSPRVWQEMSCNGFPPSVSLYFFIPAKAFLMIPPAKKTRTRLKH